MCSPTVNPVTRCVKDVVDKFYNHVVNGAVSRTKKHLLKDCVVHHEAPQRESRGIRTGLLGRSIRDSSASREHPLDQADDREKGENRIGFEENLKRIESKRRYYKRVRQDAPYASIIPKDINDYLDCLRARSKKRAKIYQLSFGCFKNQLSKDR